MNNSLNSNRYLLEQSDFRKNLNSLLSKWYWFPVSIILALVIVKTFNEFKTPTYKVNCKIVMGDGLTEPLTTSEIIGAGSGIDFNRMNPINKEIGILKSKKMAEETIDSLKLNYLCYEYRKGGRHLKKRLYNNIPFRIIIDSNDFFETDREVLLKIVDPITIEISLDDNDDITKVLKIGQKFTYNKFSFGIELSDGINDLRNNINKRYSITFKSKYSLASEYAQKLLVETDPTSQNILKLSIIDENINQSIDYLNKLCELYIRNDINLRNTMASKTIEYIDLQLGILSNQLKDAEDSLVNFKKRFNVILSDENSQMEQKYMQINKDIEEVNFEGQSVISLLRIIDSVKSGKNTVFPQIISMNNNTAQQLGKLNGILIERELLLKNQSDNSPEVMLNKQLLDVNLDKMVDLLMIEQNILNSKKENLSEQLERLEKELLSLPENQRKRINFEREFKLTENIYNMYQQKRIEAILAKESTVSKIRVLDPARFEDHQMVSPRKKYNYRVVIAISLFLPALLIIFIKNLSDKVEDTDEIRIKTQATVLGKIFHAELTDELPTVTTPLSPITESFYKLYARLKFFNPEPGIKIISITSAASGDGKTFCSANLAAAMALSGKRVILLCLDLRKPKIHEIFKQKKSPGFTNFFLGKAQKEGIIYPTEIENLDIVPSGPIPPDPIKLISQNVLTDLLTDLSKTYDYVIIDTPPVGMVADAMLVGKLSDLMLIMIRLKFTRKAIFDLIEELDESNNFKNMALVVNDLKNYNPYNKNAYYRYYHQKEKFNLWSRLKKIKLS